MGPETLMDKIRDWIGMLGWRLFIWSYDGSEEDYLNAVYQEERDRRVGVRRET